MEKFYRDDGGLQIETLVIEEASMYDLFQASNVIEQFCALESLKRIIFCRNHRQLQSVSKGRVLQDVMECGTTPGKILEVNHRSDNALSDNLRHTVNSSMMNMEEDDRFEVIQSPLDHCEVETDNYGRDRVLAIQPVDDVFKKKMELGLPTRVFAYTHKEVNTLNEAMKIAILGMGCPEMFQDGCKFKIIDPGMIVPPVFHQNDFAQIVSNIGPKRFIVRR